MNFNDTYNFDPKTPGQRSDTGEALTTIGRNFIPGKQFNVKSETVPIKQAAGQLSAEWGSDGYQSHSIPRGGTIMLRGAAAIQSTILTQTMINTFTLANNLIYGESN